MCNGGPPALRPLVPLLALLLLPWAPGALEVGARWYDGLDGVKVLHPGDDCQQIVDGVLQQQKHDQFGGHRYALLFTEGQYTDLKVEIGFYTSVIGVSNDPAKVRIPHVYSLNGDQGGATQNFWRSVEGVTLTDEFNVWAVSQGAPIRRSVIEGNLYLSDNGGWSSGGYLADVKVKGNADMGTQQQWFFRNADFGQGVACPVGWNYVFVGVNGLNASGCQGPTSGKVVEFADTPRIAEKPYLVLEDGGERWSIHVPAFLRASSRGDFRGSTVEGGAIIARTLDIDSEVFVAKPGLSAADINQGMRGKKGLLVTPGVYHLQSAIEVVEDGFVVLGLAYATLISLAGQPALRVASGLADVRVAGLLLEAGSVIEGQRSTQLPLLAWGSPSASGDAAAPRRAPGVLSDLFARVGSFQYEGCKTVGVNTMVEINSDDVVVDNMWLWHADHDDCGVNSDNCYSAHGLVVNGHRVTVYGLSAEHAIDGDIVQWNGEEGETYFYQCELPYHAPAFATAGYVGYSVSASVRSHSAAGLGVYIVGDMKVKRAYLGPPTMTAQSLVTVVIGNSTTQFTDTFCTRSSQDTQEETCKPPEQCDNMRCVLGARAAGEQGRLAPPRGNRPIAPAPTLAATTPAATTTTPAAVPPLATPAPALSATTTAPAPATTTTARPEFLVPPEGPPVPVPARHRLKVTVVKATGLQGGDWLGGTDPFCIVVLSGAETGERARFETPQFHNTQDPEWNYQQLLPSSADEDSLEFVVLDRDFWRTSVVGRAALTSDQFSPQGFEGDLPLAEADEGATLRVKVEVLPDIPGLRGIMQKYDHPSTSGMPHGAAELLAQVQGLPTATLLVATVALVAAGAVVTIFRRSARSCRGASRRPGSWERLLTVDWDARTTTEFA